MTKRADIAVRFVTLVTNCAVVTKCAATHLPVGRERIKNVCLSFLAHKGVSVPLTERQSTKQRNRFKKDKNYSKLQRQGIDVTCVILVLRKVCPTKISALP